MAVSLHVPPDTADAGCARDVRRGSSSYRNNGSFGSVGKGVLAGGMPLRPGLGVGRNGNFVATLFPGFTFGVSGRTMFTGNAVKAWRHLEVTEAQYAEYFRTLAAKRDEYKGRMRVSYHEAGLLEELRYRLEHPAALLIVLPNGLVKLINALPFICGDLRRQTLPEVWANFRRAWKDPRVAEFIEELAVDPGRTRTLHQWVHV